MKTGWACKELELIRKEVANWPKWMVAAAKPQTNQTEGA